MYWNYTALTSSGQETQGTIPGPKERIVKELEKQRYLVIELTVNYKRSIISILKRKKISTLAMAEFFEDFSNMLEIGMSFNQIFSILYQTTKDEVLVNALSKLKERLKHGDALNECFANFDSFPGIVPITIGAGERTGRLNEATHTLGKYFRNCYQIRSRLHQALIYPIFVFILLFVVMFFVCLRVIPQLKSLLPIEALHHQTTQWVLSISYFLQQYSIFVAVFLMITCFMLDVYRRKYRNNFQKWLYSWPCLGNIFKESGLAIYFLNLSVLLKSGVSLLKAIESLNEFKSDLITENFSKSKEYILGGASFWQALELNKFFPSIIPYTLRRAEEMVKLDEYCYSLSDHFQKQVNVKVDGFLNFVQPVLLALGGGFLILIALAFLIPVYSSLNIVAAG